MDLLVGAHFYLQKKGKGGLALGRTATLSHNRGSGFDPQGCKADGNPGRGGTQAPY